MDAFKPDSWPEQNNKKGLRLHAALGGRRLETGRTGGAQVSLLTLMVGNFDEKSLALSAILTATARATAL